MAIINRKIYEKVLSIETLKKIYEEVEDEIFNSIDKEMNELEQVSFDNVLGLHGFENIEEIRKHIKEY